MPFTSTVVFAVRKGNPKGIKDWPDLVKPGVEIITPNPKTSGNGKLSFLAAWGSVTQRGGSEEQAKAFVTKLYQQAPVLDSGARGSTITFAEKGIGDVQLTWENEAHLEVAGVAGELEIVYPPISFLAEPPVAVVDVNARRKGTTRAAEAYLGFLFTPEGQEIGAKHYYRPSDPQRLATPRGDLPYHHALPDHRGGQGLDRCQRKFFNDGADFRQHLRKEVGPCSRPTHISNRSRLPTSARPTAPRRCRSSVCSAAWSSPWRCGPAIAVLFWAFLG